MTDSADLVVVGGGTIGGWASVFAKADGSRPRRRARARPPRDGRLVPRGRHRPGAGRDAGHGRLGRWTVAFYRGQQAAYGTDSGFRELGYLILAVTEDDERAGRERVAMQRREGLDVRWLSREEAVEVVPTLASTGHRGGSFLATDGAIDPPRNVRAYSLAMQAAGVELRERTAFRGLRLDGSRVVGVETDGGPIATERVLLTGGPSLREVGRLAGLRIPAGAARHSVAVLEAHESFSVERMPMVFDIGAGLYWRLEEGGLLFGWSDPDEQPGEARSIDWAAFERWRERLAGFVPLTRDLGVRRVWCATIDYTPDHLPILGPAVTPAGDRIDGVTIASAGGHGMMWGPAVSRVAVDLALTGMTSLIDVTDLGLDRFDAEGRSRWPRIRSRCRSPQRPSEVSRLQQIRRHEPAQVAAAGPRRAVDVDPCQCALLHLTRCRSRTATGHQRAEKSGSWPTSIARRGSPASRRIASTSVVDAAREPLVKRHRHAELARDDVGGLRGADLRRAEDRVRLKADPGEKLREPLGLLLALRRKRPCRVGAVPCGRVAGIRVAQEVQLDGLAQRVSRSWSIRPQRGACGRAG